MNITGQQTRQKQPKAKPRPDYLDAVRQLPCCICEAFGEPQMSPTTAHHPIHDRFATRKVPDTQAIPLCSGHHLGDFDTSKLALHRAPSKWRRIYGADHEWIETTQDRIAGCFGIYVDE
jgi:hypothetical protein